MKAARGYFGGRSKVYTVAKNAVERAMKYAYKHRREKKRAFRRLWIARINAGVRTLGMNYSGFINKLKNEPSRCLQIIGRKGKIRPFSFLSAYYFRMLLFSNGLNRIHS